jgi:hypothetical protein
MCVCEYAQKGGKEKHEKKFLINLPDLCKYEEKEIHNFLPNP